MAGSTLQITNKKRSKLADKSDANLVRLVDALQGIDETKKLAALNQVSIADNNGGRIAL